VSIQDDVHAVLVADPAVYALVRKRVSLATNEEGESLPYVIYTVAVEPQHGLAGAQGLEQGTVTLACWAASAVAAEELADAVQAALEAYDAVQTSASVTVIGRQPDFDTDTQLDGVVLAVEWWAQ
jgi:hypothetical protein